MLALYLRPGTAERFIAKQNSANRRRLCVCAPNADRPAFVPRRCTDGEDTARAAMQQRGGDAPVVEDFASPIQRETFTDPAEVEVHPGEGLIATDGVGRHAHEVVGCGCVA